MTTSGGPGTRPLIAIVGRPNVGKSSLFNAFVGKRAAIVSEIAGTTRDRLALPLTHLNRDVLLVDTGGLVEESESAMDAHIAAQVSAAVSGADAVVLVVDARTGITPADQHVAAMLRRQSKPVVVAVNKVDNFKQEALALEAYELGLGDPIPVSAQHRTGLDDVLDAVVGLLPPAPEVPVEEEAPLVHIALVGRPNVGKSATVNAILGHERSIVSEIAGTTRDALDTPFAYQETPAVLIDTAGIRRRGAIAPGIERYSVLRAMRALYRADVVVVLLDAREPATDQDLHIAGQAMEAFKGVVVAVNKWDLATPEQREHPAAFRKQVLERLRFMAHVPVVFMSALEREGIDNLLETVFAVHERRSMWVPPEHLSRVVMTAIGRHTPPSTNGGVLKLYRVKQEGVAPPTFVFYCNNPTRVHFSYERFLENTIRETFGFEGTHLKLEFRGKGKVHVIGGHRAKGVPRSSRAAARAAERPPRGRRHSGQGPRREG
ncbi:MAG: ribosome biogenesis GTPase Der [Chloroflexota bacterium]